jgi:hypothetical protein
VTDSRGDLAGAIHIERWALDLWDASVYLPDVGAARVIAGIINRRSISGLSGTGSDVVPLIPHLDRARAIFEVPRLILHPPVEDVFGDAGESTRFASMLDLDALVKLYRHYEILTFPTSGQLRRYLRRRIREEFIAVYETENDGIVFTIEPDGLGPCGGRAQR